ncbi:cell wall-active antibiotics response protein LiaF [Enterococcus mediterraneensis]|uniref:cell wall-active antibiotics response protein LiaF n=1 Tax=Enterococcus mediterraneensis TaxID=2364791 RepID=UPI000F0519E5|nr:cell wall-active antibiotics response protein LiaF [Enterococcus mediterraneensis]
MNNPWRFFIVVEALLFLFAIWQILSNPPLLMLLLFGIFSIYVVTTRKQKTNFYNFLLIIGCLAIFISLLNSPALWIMLIFAILFIGLKGFEVSGIDLTKNAFWRKKQMIIVETDEPHHHQARTKQQWFGNERIGNQVYEWDDINVNILYGDTIIDLGNTILPKKDNIVLIRKGFGRTRILVPSGVGVMLEHATIIGEVNFEGEKNALRNESLKIYSEDYDENTRRIKIITNTLFGDIEVIRV